MNGKSTVFGLLVALLCVASTGGAELIQSYDFTGSAQGCLVTGSAGYESNYMRLTNTGGGLVGTVMLPRPNKALPTYHFYADMYIGGGGTTGADGMCFSYGNIADNANFMESGSGSGLELCIRTYTNRWMELKYNGSIIASWNYGSGDDATFHTSSWVPIEIIMTPDGKCTIFHNRYQRLGPVTVPGWSPQSTWRVAVAARTGGAVDNHYVDNIRVTTSEPFVNSISRASANPVGGATTSVQYTVALSEPVNSLDTADFNLTQVSGNPTAAIFSVSAASVNAAEYFGTDGSPGIGELNGNATTSEGVLKLTEAANGQTGRWYYNPGKAMTAFHAAYALRVGGGTSADGTWFAYAPKTYPSTEGDSDGLYIIFDSYDNSGETTPDISVKYKNNVYAVARKDFRGDTYRNVSVTVTTDGLCTVVYDGAPIVADLPLSGWAPQSSWWVGFGAFTGGSNDRHYVDNFTLTDNTHTVTLNSLAGTGQLRMNLNNGSVQDKYGANITPTSFTTGEAYDFDYTPPTAPSVNGTTPTNNPRPTWSWTSGGGGNGTYRYQLDGSGWTETTSTSFTPGGDLSAGSHTLAVQERDALANWSVSSFFDIFLDFSPPVIDVCPAPQSGQCPATVANFVPGVTAHDNSTAQQNLVITQSPAAGTPVGLGPHTVTITVKDQFNYQSTCETTFTSSDTVAPVITLGGSPTVTVECGSAYVDAGASAADACAGSPGVAVGGSVNTGAPGVYTLTYNATDGTNAAAEKVRVVTVSDTVAPVITLTGSAAVAVECGDTYTDAGATALDVCAGSLTATTGGSVNTGVPGAYTLTYNATDGTNAAAEVTRVVTVSDTTAPVITTCPPDQTIALDSACEAVVPDFTAQLAASDVCDTNPAVVQSPAAGTHVLEGETVVTLTVTDDASNFTTCTAKLTVLRGDCSATTVPNLVGLSRTAAEAALRNAHLVVGRLSSHCGDADIPGMVVGQVPAASDDPVPSYSAVNLVVSQGRCQTGECPAP